MKRFVSLALILVMCLSLMAGCSVLPPKNAEDLAKRSAEAMADVNNFRLAMSMSVDSKLKGGIQGIQMDISMPIEADFTFDYTGKYMHGEMNMSADIKATISALGQSESMSESMDESSEVYFVYDEGEKEVTIYTCDNGGTWTKTVEDQKDNLDSIKDLLGNSNIFTNATMKKVDGSYVVSVKMSDVFKDESFIKYLEEGSFSDMLEGSNIDWEDFSNIVGDSVMSYTFDSKTYYLQKISAEGIEITDLNLLAGIDGMDFDGMDMDELSMVLSINLELSKYNEIDSNDVKVPKDVKNSAVDESNIVDSPVFPDKPEIPEGTGTSDMPTEPHINPSLDGGVSQNNVSFYYNGVRLSVPTDYSVFLNDGWYVVDDGLYASFVCMENDKYPFVMLYLYTNDYSGTEAYVREHGADGFDLELNPEEGYPDLSIAGITFGSSEVDVVGVFGEPNWYTKSDNYVNMGWDVTYDGTLCYLSISLLDDKVCDFDLSSWG